MRTLAITVLYPRYTHPAVEERYASWQTQMLLRGSGAELVYYSDTEKARDVLVDVDTEAVIVVTDPLLLPSRNLPQRLAELLATDEIVVPSSNESDDGRQRVAAPAPYVTLRELQLVFERFESQPESLERVAWGSSDPGLYACRTELLRDAKSTLRRFIEGRNVAISRANYIHRWSSMRGQARLDLLERISPDARSILEFGCGEAPLGAALKARQKCRVVGIELDRRAANIARRRIDDVYEGDAREIVSLIHETFDWIVGGDIVEHLDEPWSFLAELRRISTPGGRLLLSLPNLANASVAGDLLRGRFDYVYMGLTCAGHLRFFTKQSIEEMLDIAGWRAEKIEPQAEIITPAAEELMRKLEAADIEFSREDLMAPGYYVTAIGK